MDWKERGLCGIIIGKKKKKGLKDVTAKCSGLFIPDPDLNKQL